jgi:DNA-binding NtrC family response regulator
MIVAMRVRGARIAVPALAAPLLPPLPGGFTRFGRARKAPQSGCLRKPAGSGAAPVNRARPGPPPAEAGEGSLSVKRATRALEERLIRAALERTGGNRTRAAELLELSYGALLYKIKEYGVG